MFTAIVTKFKAWRASAREHELAWKDQIIAGTDGLSQLQRSITAALSDSIDSFSQATCNMPEKYLRFDFPDTNTFIFAYLDGAEVHGPRPWRAEHWDFPTPQEFIAAMIVAVQSNNSFKPTPLRGAA